MQTDAIQKDVTHIEIFKFHAAEKKWFDPAPGGNPLQGMEGEG